MNTLEVLLVQTLNGQLHDREEQFAEFDTKCIGLQSRTSQQCLAKQLLNVTRLNHLITNQTWNTTRFITMLTCQVTQPGKKRHQVQMTAAVNPFHTED